MSDSRLSIDYVPPGPVAKAFLKSDAFVRGLRGPIGSGKSGACCIEIMRRAMQQRPNPKDGIRRSRWAIIRNTYAELRTTTIKTWKDWFPEEVFGHISMHPPPYTQMIRKGQIELELLFIALDSPEDVKKLLSLELTGAYINEAREVPKAIIDAVTSRLRRFPALKDGGSNWFGLIMDTNAPDEEHWWPVMAGEVPIPDHFSQADRLLLVKPNDWEFFNQPGAMLPVYDKAGAVTGYMPNPEGENVQNLDPEYYPGMMGGKRQDWIMVNLCNRLGKILTGRPVMTQFNRTVHVAPYRIEAVKGVPIYVGLDFGLTPAAVCRQQVHGQWRIIGELVERESGVKRFVPKLRAYLAERFPEHQPELFKFFGDPSGDNRSQTDEDTPFKILRAGGINAYPASTNDISIRLSAQEAGLMRMIDGKPGLIISADCKHMIAAYDGGYEYKRVGKGENYDDTPNKNEHSHPMDADQYACLGAGEGRKVIGTGGQQVQTNGRQTYSPWDRRGRPGGREPNLRQR